AMPLESPEIESLPPTPGLLRRLRTPLIVLGITLAECVAAYLYFPSTSDVSAQAESTIVAEVAQLTVVEPENTAQPEMAEVDLGEFRVTAFEPISNVAMRIEFHVWGTILEADSTR